MTQQGTEVRTARPSAVYIPLKTWMDGIDTLTQGIPNAIDRSVWSHRPNATRSQILSAFKFLGLIDLESNHPQDILRELVDARKSDNQVKQSALVKQLLESSYPEIMASAGQYSSNDKFRDIMQSKYKVSGTTLDRAVRFFLDAADFAGVNVSPHWSRRGLTSNRRRRIVNGESAESGSNSGETVLEDGELNFHLHESVAALLKDLECVAPEWDTSQKEKWLDTFHVVLDYAYPPKTPSDE